MTLDDALRTALSWRPTGRAEFPYAASADGRDWLIRVNDFPAEAFYTLIVDGREIGDLDDWPPVWRRPD
jgi:hypothetical protein